MPAEPAVDGTLSPAQVRFFETFGFLKLPGLFSDDVPRIVDGFEEVFASADDAQWLSNKDPLHFTDDPEHQSQKRLIIPLFIERSERLSWLRDDPRVTGVVRSLLGERTMYSYSDGNRFYCNVAWHSDIYASPLEEYNIKLYWYLDELDGGTGALRVMPLTNHYDAAPVKELRNALQDRRKVEERFGCAIDELPSWTLSVQPGDLLIGNFRTLHGSFGGAPGRRLFTVNFKRLEHAASSAEAAAPAE
jgi:hypothetical protein